MYEVSLFKSTGHICQGSLTYINPMPNILWLFKELIVCSHNSCQHNVYFFTHSRYLSPIKGYSQHYEICTLPKMNMYTQVSKGHFCRGPSNLESNMLSYIFVTVFFFLPNPTFLPSLSDWSCIISCLVFSWDTLLKSWLKTASSTFQEVHFDGSYMHCIQ